MSTETPDLEEVGAILNVPGEHTTPVTARSYTHPGLGDRVVVRIVGESVTPAEDATLAVLGLSATGGRPIGHTRRRTIGFPAWAIINDPTNARHAITAAADLQRARRLVKNSANSAKAAITDLASRLGASAPHFVPTFLEEAGRLFLDAESPTYAAQMFGLARESESTHALEVDEDRHREAFLEFAFAGAVSVKALTAEARRLASTHTPELAHELLTTLVIRRIKGGLPPYSSMRTDLRRSAKAAGLDDAEQSETLIRTIIDIPALANANAAFWREYSAPIEAAAQQDPRVIETLLSIAPTSVPVEDWLALLDRTGAIDRLRQPGAPATRWVQTMTNRLAEYSWRSVDDQTGFRDLLAEPAIRANAVAGDDPVTLPLLVGARRLHPELMDTLIEMFGERIVAPKGVSSYRQPIDFEMWWRDRSSSGGLIHLAGYRPLAGSAHLGFAQLMTAHSERVVGADYTVVDAGVAAAVLDSPGLRAIMRSYVAAMLGDSGPIAHTIESMRKIEHWLSPLSRPELVDALADELAVLAPAADPACALTHNLKVGIPAELFWPNVSDRIDAIRSKTRPVINESWPLIGLAENGTVAFYDRAGTVVGEFAQANTINDGTVGFAALSASDGRTDILSFWHNADYDLEYAWSSTPTTTATSASFWIGGRNTDLSVQIGENRIFGKRSVLRPGGPPTAVANRSTLLTDGERVWSVTGSANISELDPTTGTVSGSSWPTWISATAEEIGSDWTLHAESLSMFVLDGQIDGLAAWYRSDRGPRRWLVQNPAGIRVEIESDEINTWNHPARLIEIPGGRRWLVLSSDAVLDAETGQLITGGPGYNDPLALPAMYWPMLVGVAPHTGPLLRNATEAGVAGLLGVSGAKLTKRVERFLGATDPRIVTPLVTVAEAVAARAARLAELLAPPPREKIVDREAGYAAVDSAAALSRFLTGDWKAFEVISGLVSAATKLSLPTNISTIRYLKDESTWSYNGVSWPLVWGQERAFLTAAASPLCDDDSRRGLAELLRAFADSGLAQSQIFLRRLRAPNWGDRRGQQVAANEVVLAQSAYDGGNPYGYCWYSIGVGEPQPLSGTNLEPVDVIHGPADNPGLDALQQVVRDIAEHGDAIGRFFDDADWPRFAEITNTSPEVGRLLLAAPAARRSYGHELSKEDRDRLGLKTTDIRLARAVLAGLSERDVIAIANAACPADPTQLITSGIDVVAAAEEFCRRRGGPMPIGVATIGAARAEIGGDEEVVLLTTGGGAAAAELRAQESQNTWSTVNFITALRGAVAWLGYRLPADDPVRAAVHDGAYAASHVATDEGLRLAVGNVEAERAAPLLGIPEVRENHTSSHGAIDVANENNAHWLQVYVRTADLTAHDIPILHALFADAADHTLSQLATLVALAQGGLKALADTIAPPPGLSGELRDPRSSVPDLASRVAGGLSLSDDAATYYLQLLALPDPTDKNIKEWNGWTAARLKKAAAELVDAELAVTAKRARAGRSVFLPGGWITYGSGPLPFEMWKAPLYEMEPVDRSVPPLGAVLPLTDVPTLFERAWRRRETDGAPGYSDLATAVDRKQKGR